LTALVNHQNEGNGLMSSYYPRKRVTARLPVSALILLEEATVLAGLSSLEDFLVQAAMEKAQRLIAEQRVMELSQRDTEAFYQVLDNPPPPNQQLIAAFQRHQVMLGHVAN
jgi:uncharacterized protein (DUF1778 family)